MRVTGGDQPDQLGEVARPEQHHRVDVAVADPQTEVQHGAVVVVAVVVLAGAAAEPDDVAARDLLTGPHQHRRQEGVRGPQATCVGHGDMERAGDAAREADDTVVGGTHLGARGHRRSRRRGARPRRPRTAARTTARPDRRPGGANPRCRTPPARAGPVAPRATTTVSRMTIGARRRGARRRNSGTDLMWPPRGRRTSRRRGNGGGKLCRRYRWSTRLPRGKRARSPGCAQ